MLEINIEQNADATLVVIKGRMETVAAQDSENKFKSLDEATAGTIYLDCKELEYISSSGLRLFLGLQKKVMKNGGKLIFRHVSEPILNVFKITGMSAFFMVENER